MPIFEPLFAINTPKKGSKRALLTLDQLVWVLFGVIILGVFKKGSKSMPILTWESQVGSKRGLKKGYLGSFGGQKGLFWALFGGPYLRGLKKGLQKRPIGAKTCSDRPISCKKGSKKGVKKGPFGVLYLIVLVNSRFACISSWRSRLQEWFKASKTVFSLLGTAEILARP